MKFRIFAMISLLTLPAVAIADGTIEAAQLKFFESKVRLLLASKCVQCHGAEKQKGELRLDSIAAMLKGGESGPAVVPAKPHQVSEVLNRRLDGAMRSRD